MSLRGLFDGQRSARGPTAHFMGPLGLFVQRYFNRQSSGCAPKDRDDQIDAELRWPPIDFSMKGPRDDRAPFRTARLVQGLRKNLPTAAAQRSRKGPKLAAAPAPAV
jgi:hypothetical protein